MLPQSRSNASSVTEDATPDKSFRVSGTADRSNAPSYDELVRRLKRTQEGIDWLLGNPELKPTDRELGVFILRQTTLFGKETDQITAKQQAKGIRHLNRGPGVIRRRCSGHQKGSARLVS